MEEGLVVAGRYRLERPLGSGGMGAVWAATHLVTHKTLALKFVLKKHDDPAARRRVLREARAACAVRHANVVAVHDVVEHADGTPVLVMDLLEGEPLAATLGRERTLSPARVVAIARGVLAALAAAHDVGIVHRDLKPENLFLLRSGDVKILDFGIAKLNGTELATKETNRLTETGAMIGTPHYMAPEQAFGEADVDARADLWALGAVLYECLSGVPPTEGQNLGQILKVLATGTIEPLARRSPKTPSDLAAIVDSLLRVERDERPASAAEVLARLDAIGSLSEIAAPPAHAADASRSGSFTPRPAASSRPATSGRRASWLVALAGASLVVAVAAAGVKMRGVGAPARTVASTAPLPASALATSVVMPPAVSVPSAVTAPASASMTARRLDSAPLPRAAPIADAGAPSTRRAAAPSTAEPSPSRPRTAEAPGGLLDHPTF